MFIEAAEVPLRSVRDGNPDRELLNVKYEGYHYEQKERLPMPE